MNLAERLRWWNGDQAWAVVITEPELTTLFPTLVENGLIGTGLEIEIKGTMDAYDPIALITGEAAVRQLATLVDAATTYLSQIALKEVFSPSSSYLPGIYVGIHEARTNNSVELMFTNDNDPFGEWYVCFRYYAQLDTFTPYFMGRMAI